jgi:hypothetical protein
MTPPTNETAIAAVMFGLQRSGICCEQHGGSGLRAAEVRQGPNMVPPGVSHPGIQIADVSTPVHPVVGQSYVGLRFTGVTRLPDPS